MKKTHTLLWLIPLILLLMLVPFVVPSALSVAGAEELDLPVYAPVDLSSPDPDPMFPLPSPKEENPTPYAPHADGFVFDEATGAAWEYRDGTTYVKIETRVINDTKVYFTWVQIASAGQLRTQVTRETSPVKLSKRLNAVLAINGDWYTGRREGTIYRNAVQMRAPRATGNYDALIIDDEGDFHILCRPDDSAFAPYEGHIMHSFLFGPGLVVDGKLMSTDETTFIRNEYGSGPGMGLPVKAQRQAICQMDKLSYLILTTEGPDSKQDKDHGFTAGELAELAFKMGAVNAYNLDGGNSACLVLNGVKMNRFGKGGVRDITDLIYFITAEPAPAATDAPAETPDEAEGSTAQ